MLICSYFTESRDWREILPPKRSYVSVLIIREAVWPIESIENVKWGRTVAKYEEEHDPVQHQETAPVMD